MYLRLNIFFLKIDYYACITMAEAFHDSNFDDEMGKLEYLVHRLDISLKNVASKQ